MTSPRVDPSTHHSIVLARHIGAAPGGSNCRSQTGVRAAMTLSPPPMQTMKLRCLALLTTLTIATGTHADDALAPSSFSLGLAAVSSVSPYPGYDQKVWPFPAVHYDSGRFYVDGIAAGYYLVKRPGDDLSLDLTVATNDFDPTQTSDAALRKLDRRSPSLMAGLRYRHRASWGLVQANVAHDVSGHSVGETAQFEYGFPVLHGVFDLVPSVGEGWSSGKFNSYYYGITPGESAESGLPVYRPGAGWNPYGKLVMDYHLGARWNVFAQARYTWLGDAVRHSPMVDQRSLTSYLVGLSYTF